MTTRTSSPEVLANRSGRCPGCTDLIQRREDYIVKVEGKGWMHAACARDYLRHLEQFAELNYEDVN